MFSGGEQQKNPKPSDDSAEQRIIPFGVGKRSAIAPSTYLKDGVGASARNPLLRFLSFPTRYHLFHFTRIFGRNEDVVGLSHTLQLPVLDDISTDGYLGFA